MRARIWCSVLAAVAVASVSACGNAGEDRVLSIESTGVVGGFVYFDRDGTRGYGLGDDGLNGIRVALVVRGGMDTVASATTDGEGLVEILGVPAGRYAIHVNAPELGDSVDVVSIEDSEIDVGPNDSISFISAVSYPFATVSEARALAIGTKVFVAGITLNARTTFGDSTIHLADLDGAVRITDVARVPVLAGDSIRVLGTVQQRDGQPVLAEPQIFILAVSEVPPPEEVSTAEADTAGGGRLDAAFVKVIGAEVSDTATSGDDLSVVVNDGSGALEVLLDGDIGFAADSIAPGDTVDVAGLLVPAGARWQLKPRTSFDLERK